MKRFSLATGVSFFILSFCALSPAAAGGAGVEASSSTTLTFLLRYFLTDKEKDFFKVPLGWMDKTIMVTGAAAPFTAEKIVDYLGRALDREKQKIQTTSELSDEEMAEKFSGNMEKIYTLAVSLGRFTSGSQAVEILSTPPFNLSALSRPWEITPAPFKGLLEACKRFASAPGEKLVIVDLFFNGAEGADDFLITTERITHGTQIKKIIAFFKDEPEEPSETAFTAYLELLAAYSLIDLSDPRRPTSAPTKSSGLLTPTPRGPAEAVAGGAGAAGPTALSIIPPKDPATLSPDGTRALRRSRSASSPHTHHSPSSSDGTRPAANPFHRGTGAFKKFAFPPYGGGGGAAAAAFGAQGGGARIQRFKGPRAAAASLGSGSSLPPAYSSSLGGSSEHPAHAEGSTSSGETPPKSLKLPLALIAGAATTADSGVDTSGSTKAPGSLSSGTGSTSTATTPPKPPAPEAAASAPAPGT